MVPRVTFDTNIFTRFINSKQTPNGIVYAKILRAIKDRKIKGYFSDTFVILEGIMKNERSRILGSRKICSSSSSVSGNKINIRIGPSMYKPELHETHLCTVKSLIGLRGPVYLGDNFSVPLNIDDLYESISLENLIKFRTKMGEVEIAIANNNNKTGLDVGKCRARNLGLRLLKRENKNGEIWYQGLGLCI